MLSLASRSGLLTSRVQRQRAYIEVQVQEQNIMEKESSGHKSQNGDTWTGITESRAQTLLVQRRQCSLDPTTNQRY